MYIDCINRFVISSDRVYISLIIGVVLLLLLIIQIGISFLALRSYGSVKNWKLIALSFLIIVVLIMGLCGLYVPTKKAIDLLNRYSRNDYEVCEGQVHVLSTQPAEGHTKGDIINIDGKLFEINYFRLTPAYNRTIAHGGILNEGAYVRLYHYEGSILKIDVCIKKVLN